MPRANNNLCSSMALDSKCNWPRSVALGPPATPGSLTLATYSSKYVDGSALEMSSLTVVLFRISKRQLTPMGFAPTSVRYSAAFHNPSVHLTHVTACSSDRLSGRLLDDPLTCVRLILPSARVMRNEQGESRGLGFVSYQTPDQGSYDRCSLHICP